MSYNNKGHIMRKSNTVILAKKPQKKYDYRKAGYNSELQFVPYSWLPPGVRYLGIYVTSHNRKAHRMYGYGIASTYWRDQRENKCS